MNSRITRRLPIALSLTAAVAAAAFAQSTTKPTAPAAPADAPQKDAAPQADKAAPAKAPEIKVLDAGQSPRAVRRYDFEKGTTQRVRFTTDTTLTQSMQGQPMGTMPMLTSWMTAVATIDEIEDDGDAKYTFRIDDAGVKETGGANPMAGMVRQQMQAMVGVEGTGVITPGGWHRQTSLNAGADVPPQARQAFEEYGSVMNQTSLVLPSEPIGPGARWETVAEISQMGLDVQQKAIYELLSISGDSIEVSVKLEQTARDQTMDVPGATVTVNSLDGRGTGTTKLSLSQVLPSSANLSMEMNAEVAMGPEMTVQHQTKMTMRIQPAAQAEAAATAAEGE